MLALGIADVAFVFLTRFHQSATASIASRLLVTLRAVLLVVTSAIIVYGFYCATIFYEHWSQ